MNNRPVQLNTPLPANGAFDARFKRLFLTCSALLGPAVLQAQDGTLDLDWLPRQRDSISFLRLAHHLT